MHEERRPAHDSLSAMIVCLSKGFVGDRCHSPGVKIMVQVKLIPTSALEATLRTVNRAANDVSRTGFERCGLRGEVKRLRSECYADLRGRGLGAQVAQHIIKRVADAYATLRGNIYHGNLGKTGSKRRVKAESKPIEFRLDAAHTF